ncbi:MAG: hypothetical protein MJ138_05440 [Kiritimatiellae bacterium]|nr:hypothetical protein [Kiritimatiellia bacterium]
MATHFIIVMAVVLAFAILLWPITKIILLVFVICPIAAFVGYTLAFVNWVADLFRKGKRK